MQQHLTATHSRIVVHRVTDTLDSVTESERREQGAATPHCNTQPHRGTQSTDTLDSVTESERREQGAATPHCNTQPHRGTQSTDTLDSVTESERREQGAATPLCNTQPHRGITIHTLHSSVYVTLCSA